MEAVEQSIEEIAQARSAVYRFVLAGLDHPTREQHVWMAGPAFREALAGLCASFDLAPPEGELVPEDFADHESRYLACFEVGFPEPPVVLLSSHYNLCEPAPRIIHEHILLYRRFGVQVPAGGLDPPDHLLNQLAFLLHLDALLLTGTIERVSTLRARRDFLTRHVKRWIERGAAAARETHLPPVYQALLAVLEAGLEQDRALTEGAVADLSREMP